jgi:hypothetical protein
LRINKIDALKLKSVLEKKNPYLFKAKHLQTAQEIINEIVDAYISSSEETMFGDWLEGLAIFINEPPRPKGSPTDAVSVSVGLNFVELGSFAEQNSMRWQVRSGKEII